MPPSENSIWAQVPGYILAQVLGAMFGATLVWLAYLPHWKETPDTGAKLGIFCTAPAIRAPMSKPAVRDPSAPQRCSFGVLAIPSTSNLTGPDWATGFGPMLVGLLVFAIGLSLGGPTGLRDQPGA